MPRTIPKLVSVIFLFLGLLVLSAPSDAAQVVGVKGKRVLIQLTPEEVRTVKAGDTFFVQDGSRRLGVVRIVKIQKNRALAGLLKGRAQRGNSLAATGPAKPSKGRARTASKDGWIVGALLGFNSSQQKIKNPSRDATIDLAGSGFAGKLFADFNLIEKLGVRLEAGMEQMYVEHELDKVNIDYISGDVMLRYNVLTGPTKVYLASGMGIYYPMSYSLEPEGTPPIEKPPLQTVLLIKGGVMIPMGQKFYVPIQADYVYFPSSKQVTTHTIGGKIGLGMRW